MADTPSDSNNKSPARPAQNCWTPSDAASVFTRYVHVWSNDGPPDTSGALGQTRGFVQWMDAPLARAWARRALDLISTKRLVAAERAYPVGPDGSVPAWRGGHETPAMLVLGALQACQFVFMALNLPASASPLYREWWRKWFSGTPLNTANLSDYSSETDYSKRLPSVPMESSPNVAGLISNNAVRIKGTLGPHGDLVDDAGVPWTARRVGELRYRAARRFRAINGDGHGFTMRFYGPAFVDYEGILETCRHPLDGRGPFEDVSNEPRSPEFLRLLWQFAQCATAPLGPRGWEWRTSIYLAGADLSAPSRFVRNHNVFGAGNAWPWTERAQWTGPLRFNVGNLEDQWAVVIGGSIPDTWRTIPLDAWSADTADLSPGGEPYLSMSCTLRDIADATRELALALQADPVEIVTAARAHIVTRNLLTIRAEGSSDQALLDFANSDATAFAAAHASDQGAAMVAAGLTAAAGVAGLTGVGAPVALVLAVLGAGVSIVNSTGALAALTRGTDDTVPRDEFGRHKPWIESAWLSGNVDGPEHSVPVLPEFNAVIGPRPSLSGFTGGAARPPVVTNANEYSGDTQPPESESAMPGALKLLIALGLAAGGYEVYKRRTRGEKP